MGCTEFTNSNLDKTIAPQHNSKIKLLPNVEEFQNYLFEIPTNVQGIDLCEANCGHFFVDSLSRDSTNDSDNENSLIRHKKWKRMVMSCIFESKNEELNDFSELEISNALQLYKYKFPTKFISKVRKGPPSIYRWISWKICLNYSRIFRTGIYKKYLEEHPIEEYVDNIDKDIERTFPDHPLFKSDKFGPLGKKMLHNILVAYSNYNPSLGYCQGMNFITAFLLINSGLREEETFWIFVSIMENSIDNDPLKIKGIKGLYLNYLPLLRLFNELYKVMMKEVNNNLFQYFQKMELHELMYIDKWILTLFIYSIPYTSCIRIFDSIVSYGFSYILLFAISLILSNEGSLIKSNFQEIYVIFDNFKQEIDSEMVEKIMEKAFQLKFDWNYLENEKAKLEIQIEKEELDMNILQKNNHNENCDDNNNKDENNRLQNIQSNTTIHNIHNIHNSHNNHKIENSNVKDKKINIADTFFRNSHFFDFSILQNIKNTEFKEKRQLYEFMESGSNGSNVQKKSNTEIKFLNNYDNNQKINIQTHSNSNKKGRILGNNDYEDTPIVLKKAQNKQKSNKPIQLKKSKNVGIKRNHEISTFGKLANKENNENIQLENSNKESKIDNDTGTNIKLNLNLNSDIPNKLIPFEQMKLCEILKKSISVNSFQIEGFITPQKISMNKDQNIMRIIHENHYQI